MADKLYLIDISTVSKAFNKFLTDFISKNPVAILTNAPAAQLLPTWLSLARYVFASDGNEFYSNNRLRYKNFMLPIKEVNTWIESKLLPITRNVSNIHIATDAYTSACLVREFNNLFMEYRAYSCAHGFKITTDSDPRRNIAALISSNYNIIFISPIKLLGHDNFNLASAVMKRGRCYQVNNEQEMQQLLTSLLEK